MAAPNYHSKNILDRVLSGESPEKAAEKYRPRTPHEHRLPPRITATGDHTADALAKRIAILNDQGIVAEQLSGEGPEIAQEALARTFK